jgi:hypothetical protein
MRAGLAVGVALGMVVVLWGVLMLTASTFSVWISKGIAVALNPVPITDLSQARSDIIGRLRTVEG